MSSVKETWDLMIKHFDIPEMRRECNLSNAAWFIRNAWIKNDNNPHLKLAEKIARTLLKPWEEKEMRCFEKECGFPFKGERDV